MTRPLNVLIVEDSEDDAQLVVRTLRRGDYEVAWVRVETADAMRTALRDHHWDVILSDHSMPHFSGPAALALLKSTGLDVPFLIVSGKVGEEKAVELMHAGACDYILKDNPARLVPALERELREAEERRKRRRAEEAEKQLTAERNDLLSRLQLQIERMPLAYLLFDAQMCLIDWNPAAAAIFGYRKEDVLGQEALFERLVSPASRQQADEMLRRLRAGDMHAHAIMDNLSKDGRTITCEWLNTPLMTPTGDYNGLVCLAQDLTARKTLEAQFRQAQKMEALGQLAGGVAHDFNNLLTIINGYSDLMLTTLPKDDPSRSLVEQIKKAGDRSAALTRQLLMFSRKHVASPRLLDLNTVLSDLDKMLRRIVGEDIQLNMDLSARLRAIKADPGHVEQILFNLVVNARDAMPHGGQIRIKTANLTFEKEYARPLADLPLGAFVLLEVGDTGCGMTPEVQAHIFEPFFTTKEPGKGTGLGLATVFGIVKDCGGYLGVESQPGAGTTFRLYFPVVEEPVAEPAVQTRPESAPRGTEVVLLVEDEDGVRKLTSHFLVQCGYTVLEAKNGREGLNLASRYTAPLPILITDVVMPELGGYELADEIRHHHPETQVLFMSGYPIRRSQARQLPTGELNFLRKPFSPLALACRVRAILDAARSAAPPPATAQDNAKPAKTEGLPPPTEPAVPGAPVAQGDVPQGANAANSHLGIIPM